MTPPHPSELEAIRFPVSGMTCGSCVSRITRAVRRLDGVSGVRVDLRDELVTVRRERGRVSDAALAAAVAVAGYEADLSRAVSAEFQESAGLLSRILRRSR